MKSSQRISTSLLTSCLFLFAYTSSLDASSRPSCDTKNPRIGGSSDFLRKGWDSNPRSVISRTHDFQSCALDQLSHLCVCCVYDPFGVGTHSLVCHSGVFPGPLRYYITVMRVCQVFGRKFLTVIARKIRIQKNQSRRQGLTTSLPCAIMLSEENRKDLEKGHDEQITSANAEQGRSGETKSSRTFCGRARGGLSAPFSASRPALLRSAAGGFFMLSIADRKPLKIESYAFPKLVNELAAGEFVICQRGLPRPEQEVFNFLC